MLDPQNTGISLRERYEAFSEATDLVRSGLTGKAMAERLLDLMQLLLPSDALALWRLDRRERLWRITASRGLSERYQKVALQDLSDQPAQASLLRAPFIVDDARKWGVVEGRSSLYESEGVRKLLVLPLLIRGESAGTICCYFRDETRVISDEELAATKAFAGIASNALSVQKFDRLAEVARSISGQLDLESLVQTITDAATELTGAQFGAFFYNVINAEGESYTLYTISGVPREAFSKFPMPRNTAIFAPTFAGQGVVRSSNIQKDPRYGHNSPYYGMPAGHLPVVSYLAVPVIARSGEVLGGLFFGHSEEGVFGETEERVAESLASQAAVAIDNVRLYQSLQQDREDKGRSERRYRSLVQATPTRQAIGIATPEGFLEEDSPSWRELTGQTFEQMKGRGWLNAIDGSDRAEVAAAWDQAIASRGLFSRRFRLQMTDGSVRWFEGKAVPIEDANGKVLEWVGTSTDIDEARTNEESRLFLAKATELFSATLDYEETLKSVARLAVPDIADWCTVDMVDETRPYRRLAVAHVDPKKVEFAWELYRRYPPEPEMDTVMQVLRTGKPQLVSAIPDGMFESLGLDQERLRILEELHIMSWMIVPLRSRGRILGAVTFVSSDSRRRYTELDLELAEEFAHRAAVAIDNAQLYGAAQSANRAKDEFLATLSHELRTPMTAVLGWSRMLKMGLDEADAREAIEAIEKGATAQAQLIDDILDVSRIMSGKLRVDAKPIDLRSVTQAALTTVRPSAVAKEIEVVIDFPSSIPPVAGDEGRIQQIVWNLLSNAIKFTPRRGKVVVRIDQQGSLIRLVVQDNGEGIAPEFLPHVFEPFRQADNSTTRVHGGIGLGLAIVRYIVELHGGRISVASEGEGKGATFTVELPLVESADILPPSAPRQQEEAVHGESGTLATLRGLTILTIDDQQYSRDVVTAILKHSGAEVHAAETVRQGLMMLERVQPDLVVCDIAMPHEDGYVFLRELRMFPDKRLSGLPVIALTAFGRTEDRENALAAGFDDYVKKPVDPVDLGRAVLDVLERQVQRA